jgi:hypothetical protein
MGWIAQCNSAVELLPRALTLCVPARAEGSEQEDNP